MKKQALVLCGYVLILAACGSDSTSTTTNTSSSQTNTTQTALQAILGEELIPPTENASLSTSLFPPSITNVLTNDLRHSN